MTMLLFCKGQTGCLRKKRKRSNSDPSLDDDFNITRRHVKTVNRNLENNVQPSDKNDIEINQNASNLTDIAENVDSSIA